MQSISQNEKDHVKGFDHFFVIGLTNNEIQGEKSFNELVYSTPQILSMFPDIDLEEPENEDQGKSEDEQNQNKNRENLQNVKNLIESK